MGATQFLSATVAAAALSTSIAVAETVTYDFTGFDSVKATSGVDVIVEVGDAFSITLETDGDVERARVEVKGDTLILGRKSQRGMVLNLGRGATYEYTVTMPELRGGGASAGADLEISGIEGGEVTLDASSGAGIEAEGTCSTLRAEASSGASVDAFDLECDDVRADVSSGADVNVTASDSVRADASSGGAVRVRGNPDDRRTDKSSGGSVRFVD
ncbi:MAG: head GIN domain-containing protein [Pseudomonadota bacterium]